MLLMVWCVGFGLFCCFKQKTADEMRISDWSADVCSSDLLGCLFRGTLHFLAPAFSRGAVPGERLFVELPFNARPCDRFFMLAPRRLLLRFGRRKARCGLAIERSEEHTSELQSLMRISYAVFCLKKKN